MGSLRIGVYGPDPHSGRFALHVSILFPVWDRPFDWARKRGKKLDLIDTTAAVDTPERVRFRYRLAGPGRRAFAWMLDAMIRGVIFVVLLIALSGFMVVSGNSTSTSRVPEVSSFVVSGPFPHPPMKNVKMVSGKQEMKMASRN